jgi:hypothetical protein
MDKFTVYIFFIFLIKIIYVALASTHLYLRMKGKAGTELDKEVLFWKEHVEFLFVVLMSFLLIYLFNPRTNRIFMINYETKYLLFLFGFILIITAKWSTFFQEPSIFKKIQFIL